MKKIIYIFAFLTFGQLCYGQEKSFYVQTYLNGDTSILFKWQQERYEKAGLKNLTKATDTFHFRFATDIQAIDIWTNDFLTFMGTLTNYTSSYDPDDYKIKKEKADKFFSNTKSLDTSIARQVYDIFIEKSIFDIPPQDSIKEWTYGEDGITYFIEKSTNNSYTFKEYWTPSIFKDKIDEARRIYEMTKELEELLNLWQSFKQFIYSLPYGAYRAGGLLIITTLKPRRK